MSLQKTKGTRFESALAEYARMRTGEPRIHRVVLHGRNDLGDVGDIPAHGFTGIAECKNYKPRNKSGVPPKGLLDRWMAETSAEQRNSGSDFALLVVHRPRRSDRDAAAASFSENWCWLTLRSLYRVSGRDDEPDNPEAWVCKTVGEVFDLIVG